MSSTGLAPGGSGCWGDSKELPWEARAGQHHGMIYPALNDQRETKAQTRDITFQVSDRVRTRIQDTSHPRPEPQVPCLSNATLEASYPGGTELSSEGHEKVLKLHSGSDGAMRCLVFFPRTQQTFIEH